MRVKEDEQGAIVSKRSFEDDLGGRLIVARLDLESSNALFQELEDWEHQLQHLDGIREQLAGDNDPGVEL